MGGFRNDFCDNLILQSYGDNEYGNVSNFHSQEFKKVFVGNFQCFGIDIYDRIFAWGLNDYGQLGYQKTHDYIFKNEEEEYNPNKAGSTPFINTFFELSYPKYFNNELNIFNKIKIKQISTGDGFTIVLDSDNNLYSFGRNDEGQLGFILNFDQYKIINGKKTVLNPTKIQYFSENNILINEIISGSNFTFVLDSNNQAYSFGDNSCGQLAQYNEGYAVKPFPHPAEYLNALGRNIRKICCGWSHAILLNDCGEVYVWGNYFKDYKKVCDVKDIIIPKKIEIEDATIKEESEINEPDSDNVTRHFIVDIACGFNHLGVIVKNRLKNKKELYTWGANEFGQTGLNTDEILIKTPTQVAFSESSIEKIYCGGYHTIALMENKNIFGFGDNSYRQIGNFTSESINYPIITGFDFEPEKYELENVRIFVLKFIKIYCGNGFTVVSKIDKNFMKMKISSGSNNIPYQHFNTNDFKKIANVEMNQLGTKGNNRNDYEDNILNTNKPLVTIKTESNDNKM